MTDLEALRICHGLAVNGRMPLAQSRDSIWDKAVYDHQTKAIEHMERFIASLEGPGETP